MAAGAVEGGASLFRRECVGFGLGMRVHNLSRREEPRAGRSASHPKLRWPLKARRWQPGAAVAESRSRLSYRFAGAGLAQGCAYERASSSAAMVPMRRRGWSHLDPSEVFRILQPA